MSFTMVLGRMRSALEPTIPATSIEAASGGGAGVRQDELQRPKPPWELPPVRKLGPPDWRVLLQGVEEEEDEWGVKGEGEREMEGRRRNCGGQ